VIESVSRCGFPNSPSGAASAVTTTPGSGVALTVLCARIVPSSQRLTWNSCSVPAVSAPNTLGATVSRHMDQAPPDGR